MHDPDINVERLERRPASPAGGRDRNAARPALRLRERLARIWRPRFGLPARLLVLTALFVMLAEILIFLPSLATYRINWLNDRVRTAQVSAIAADSFPSRDVPPGLRNELLRTALVRAIAVRRAGARRVILPPVQELTIDVTYDLRQPSRLTFGESFSMRLLHIRDALSVLNSREDRTMRVIGLIGPRFDDVIEVVMPEEPLKRAMIRYGTEIFWLSLIVAIVAGALVYIIISVLFIRPILRLTRNMEAFGENPEDASLHIKPSGRTDEIGRAEVQLNEMQRQLSQLLLQKTRLAQLGLAVSKINHDLRNMLANAQLVSDRLVDLPDPTVQRIAPKLIASLDRAINFCNETLRFGRTEETIQRREVIPLKPIVEEVGDSIGLGPNTQIVFETRMADDLMIDADPDHLMRILTNLVRNAYQALEGKDATGEPGRITIEAERQGSWVEIRVKDNGPGVPPRAREKLFQPFQGSTKRGGTGLGLPIAAELAQAHGGSLRLAADQPGAVFVLRIPDSGQLCADARESSAVEHERGRD